MENPGDKEGNIFKVKRFSIHDGPGIRTSVFLKGCPLNCIWCHSPEGISSEISTWHDNSLCIACRECVKACRNGALELKNEPEVHINIIREVCTANGDCIKICPTGAIQFTGSFIRISDLMNEIEKDVLYYQVSGGGVTLTGGEPLYQPEFAIGILEACRRRNIHTSIETSLYCETEIINRISEFVDLFIVDIKIFDQRQHIRYTGKPNEIIKGNFRVLAESEKPIIIRIPLIKNITDTDENKNAIERFVHEIDSRIPIEYISGNPLAGNNYKRLGIPYLLNNGAQHQL